MPRYFPSKPQGVHTDDNDTRDPVRMSSVTHFKLIAGVGLALTSALTIGCGGSDDGDEFGRRRPNAPFSGAAEIGEGTGVQEVDFPDSPANPNERYADYAPFVFRDADGAQRLREWMLDDDGITYYERGCTVGEADGPEWGNCTAWTSGQIGDLGLGSIGKLSSLSAFAYEDTHEGKWYVVQTAFNEAGDTRVGRICPLGNFETDWASCSGWNELALDAAALGVSGAELFRGDVAFAQTTTGGDFVVTERLLSIDGSTEWTRSCTTTYQDFFGTSACSWTSSRDIASVTPNVPAIRGRGGFVYEDAGQKVYRETILSVTGTGSMSRECLLTDTGIDLASCRPWTARSIANLRVSEGQL